MEEVLRSLTRGTVEVLTRDLLPRLDFPLHDLRAEMLESIFYRNKAAYLIGRVVLGQDLADGEEVAQGLGHLLALHVEEGPVHPAGRERRGAGAQSGTPAPRLRNGTLATIFANSPSV